MMDERRLHCTAGKAPLSDTIVVCTWLSASLQLGLGCAAILLDD